MPRCRARLSNRSLTDAPRLVFLSAMMDGGFQVGPQLCPDAAALGGFHDGIGRAEVELQRFAQAFQRDIEADLVPIAKTVGNRVGGVGDADDYAFDLSPFD